MCTADDPDRLLGQYETIARGFLRDQSEERRYQAMLLGRELLTKGLGPTEAVQLHFSAAERIRKGSESPNRVGIAERIKPLLLEVMMAYGESHQEVRHVLAKLQLKYDELDRTKQALEEKTAQLVQTGKMNALGELAAGVAHEINQPLNAMTIICQDVIRDVDKDRLEVASLRGNLEEAVAEMRRLAEIVSQMRLFARKTTGTQQETLNINEPLEGVFSLIGQQLMLRDIEVVKELSADCQVVGDRVRLGQVFMNLITNARDAVAGNENGKSINVKTFRQQASSGGRRFVTFEIRDDGSGIPSHLRERIFEPFFTSKEAGNGTGLGLSVTKQIVEEHAGRIELESNEGDGTTFRVLLPEASTGSQR